MRASACCAHVRSAGSGGVASGWATAPYSSDRESVRARLPYVVTVRRGGVAQAQTRWLGTLHTLESLSLRDQPQQVHPPLVSRDRFLPNLPNT